MILVTGASGFLGTHLVEALVEQGFRVRALYHSRKPSFQNSLVEWQACDLLDVYAVQDVMQGIEEVYHCAAIVSFHKKDKELVIDQNRAATAHVVDEALNAGVQKLVHVSSIAALGRSAKADLLITEDTFWEESKTNTAYAIGKYQSELEVWRAMAEGLNAVIVNPGIILGEGDYNEGSAKLFQTVFEGLNWYTQGVNGWVDVKDVTKVMLALMRSDIEEERFILTAGNYSYQEIFSWMANALEKPAPRKLATAFLSKIIWRLSAIQSLFTGKKATITKETARTANAKSRYNNQKICSTIPEFEFRPIEETIQRVGKDFLKNR